MQEEGRPNIPWSFLFVLHMEKVGPREVPQLINVTSVPRL